MMALLLYLLSHAPEPPQLCTIEIRGICEDCTLLIDESHQVVCGVNWLTKAPTEWRYSSLAFAIFRVSIFNSMEK